MRFNNCQKYVVSTPQSRVIPALAEPDPALKAMSAETIAKLKEQSSTIWWSQWSVLLVQFLMRHKLQTVMNACSPSTRLVLRAPGRRLFIDGSPGMVLELVDSMTTSYWADMAALRPSPLVPKPSS